MARSIREIKAAMTAEFMADPTIVSRYGLAPGATFDATFSTVSIENIWFSIVASAIFVLESLFDAFREDVDTKLESAVVASIPWYHKIALEFQYGDELVFDEATQGFRYADVDESKRLVKFTAARDLGGGVYVLASGANAAGNPVALSAPVLAAFEAYMRQRKPAGVLLEVHSYAPDVVRLSMRVQFDPQLIASDGTSIADPSVRPVDAAINGYLRGIVYGGVFNKTKLVDAVQAVPGVRDVILDTVWVRPASGGFAVLAANSYTSVGGAFVTYGNTISYVLQL